MTDFLGVAAAGVLYEAGFGRLGIVQRLQDPAIMQAMAEPRAYTEAEAVAAYEEVATTEERVARAVIFYALGG